MSDLSSMPEHIDIDDLVVLHRARDSDGAGLPEEVLSDFARSSFVLDTCLRQLVIPAEAGDRAARQAALAADMRIQVGEPAYAFLLETATGLRSAVPGETNIQGQFRRAWHDCVARLDVALRCRLDPMMRRLFRDTATVRHEHLQGIGGNSYGSLVRKLLHPSPRDHILFAGTGDLSRSLLPLFRNFRLGMWNRHELHDLPEFVTSLFRPEAAADAARWATQLIMTTPADARNDALWLRLSQQHDIRIVAHLGRRREDPGPWAQQPGFLCLDDVFDLRRSQSNVRMLQLARARRRCAELAEQRRSSPGCPIEGRRAFA